MSDTSLDNLNELVYVDISNTSTSQKCPIDTTSTPCISCREKCKLSFVNAYFQASCTTFAGGLVYSNLTTNTASYLTFNENNFSVTSLYLLLPSINTYLIPGRENFVNGKAVGDLTCEFVIEAISDYGYLIIYIPVVLGISTTIPIPSSLSGTQSLSNINLYNHLPSQMPYYFFNASYKSSTANYVIFPVSSCNVSISVSDFLEILEINNPQGFVNPVKNPANNYFTLSTPPRPIYYNEAGANISNNNEYYLDCRVADEEMDENIQYDPYGSVSNVPVIPVNTQAIYNSLSFILVAIVCVIFFWAITHVATFIN